ncbi:MAG: thermonuclease family protein [Candidatus Pacearchaeota archaeon]
MNRKYAFIFALLLAGLIMCDIFILNSFSIKTDTMESVIIKRVIDGDTIELSDNRIIRLANINSPEKNTLYSNLSIIFLKSFENKTVEVEILGKDKYNRYLARVYGPSYINLEIVSMGLASKFLVNDKELDKFAEAEKKAIENSLGIWKKSEFFGCFDSSIDSIKEEVILKNNCPDINLYGWIVKDESRKTYIFPNISFTKIKLHSEAGISNSTDLFLKFGDIWNNDRDSLYLFDNMGRLAHYETYGY